MKILKIDIIFVFLFLVWIDTTISESIFESAEEDEGLPDMNIKRLDLDLSSEGMDPVEKISKAFISTMMEFKSQMKKELPATIEFHITPPQGARLEYMKNIERILRNLIEEMIYFPMQGFVFSQIKEKEDGTIENLKITVSLVPTKMTQVLTRDEHFQKKKHKTDFIDLSESSSDLNEQITKMLPSLKTMLKTGKRVPVTLTINIKPPKESDEAYMEETMTTILVILSEQFPRNRIQSKATVTKTSDGHLKNVKLVITIIPQACSEEPNCFKTVNINLVESEKEFIPIINEVLLKVNKSLEAEETANIDFNIQPPTGATEQTVKKIVEKIITIFSKIYPLNKIEFQIKIFKNPKGSISNIDVLLSIEPKDKNIAEKEAIHINLNSMNVVEEILKMIPTLRTKITKKQEKGIPVKVKMNIKVPRGVSNDYVKATADRVLTIISTIYPQCYVSVEAQITKNNIGGIKKFILMFTIRPKTEKLDDLNVHDITLDLSKPGQNIEKEISHQIIIIKSQLSKNTPHTLKFVIQPPYGAGEDFVEKIVEVISAIISNILPNNEIEAELNIRKDPEGKLTKITMFFKLIPITDSPKEKSTSSSLKFHIDLTREHTNVVNEIVRVLPEIKNEAILHHSGNKPVRLELDIKTAKNATEDSVKDTVNTIVRILTSIYPDNKMNYEVKVEKDEDENIVKITMIVTLQPSNIANFPMSINLETASVSENNQTIPSTSSDEKTIKFEIDSSSHIVRDILKIFPKIEKKINGHLNEKPVNIELEIKTKSNTTEGTVEEIANEISKIFKKKYPFEQVEINSKVIKHENDINKIKFGFTVKPTTTTEKFTVDLTKPGTNLATYLESVIPGVYPNIKPQLEKNQKVLMQFKIKPPHEANNKYIQDISETLMRILPKFFPENKIRIRAKTFTDSDGHSSEIIVDIIIEPSQFGKEINEDLDGNAEPAGRSAYNTLSFDLSKPGTSLTSYIEDVIPEVSRNMKSKLEKNHEVSMAFKIKLPQGSDEKYIKETTKILITILPKFFPGNEINIKTRYSEGPDGQPNELIADIIIKPKYHETNKEVINENERQETTAPTGAISTVSPTRETFSFDLTKPGTSLTSYIEEVMPKVSTNIKTRLEKKDQVSMIFKIKPPEGSDEKYLKETTEILMKTLPKFFPDGEISIKTQYLEDEIGHTKDIIVNIIIKPKSSEVGTESATKPADEMKSEPATTPKYIPKESTLTDEENILPTNGNTNWQSTTAREETTELAVEQNEQGGRSSSIINNSEKKAPQTNAEETTIQEKSTTTKIPDNHDISDETTTSSSRLSEDNGGATVKPTENPTKSNEPKVFTTTESSQYTTTSTPTSETTFAFDLTKPGSSLTNYIEKVIPEVTRNIRTRLEGNHEVSMTFKIKPPRGSDEKYLKQTTEILIKILPKFFPDDEISVKTHYVRKPENPTEEIVASIIIKPKSLEPVTESQPHNTKPENEVKSEPKTLTPKYISEDHTPTTTETNENKNWQSTTVKDIAEEETKAGGRSASIINTSERETTQNNAEEATPQQPAEKETTEVFTTTEIPRYLSTSSPTSETTFAFDLTKPGSSLTSYVEKVIPEVTTNIRTRLERNHKVSMTFKIKPPQGSDEKYLKQTTEILIKILPKFFPNDEISVKTQYVKKPESPTEEIVASIIIKPKSLEAVTESEPHNTKSEDEIKSEPTTLTPKYISEDHTRTTAETIENKNWQSTTLKDIAEEETRAGGRSASIINTSEKETTQNNAEETTPKQESTSIITSNSNNIFQETTVPTVKSTEQPTEKETTEVFTTTEILKYLSTSFPTSETTFAFDLTKPGSSLTSYVERVIPRVSTTIRTQLESNHEVPMIFKIKPPQGSDGKYLKETTEILLKILPKFFPDDEISVRTQYLEQPKGLGREIIVNIIIKPKLVGTVTESGLHNTESENGSEATTMTPKYISEESTLTNEEAKAKSKGKSSSIINASEGATTLSHESTTTTTTHNKLEETTTLTGRTDNGEAKVKPKEEPSENEEPKEFTTTEISSYSSTPSPTSEPTFAVDLTKPGTSLTSYIEEVIPEASVNIRTRLERNHQVSMIFKIKPPQGSDDTYLRKTTESVMKILPKFFPNNEISVKTHYSGEPKEVIANIIIKPKSVTVVTESELHNTIRNDEFKSEPTTQIPSYKSEGSTLPNEENIRPTKRNEDWQSTTAEKETTESAREETKPEAKSSSDINNSEKERTHTTVEETKPQEESTSTTSSNTQLVSQPVETSTGEPIENDKQKLLTTTEFTENISTTTPTTSETTFAFDLTKPGSSLTSYVEKIIPKVSSNIRKRLQSNNEVSMILKIKPPQGSDEEYLKETTKTLMKILPKFFPDDEISVKTHYLEQPEGSTSEIVANIIIKPKVLGTVTESEQYNTKSEDELKSKPTTLSPKYISQESSVPNEDKIISTTRIDNWQSTTAKEETTGSAEEETKSNGKSSLRINTSEKETKQTNAEETTQQEEPTSTTSNSRNILEETTAPTRGTSEDMSGATVKPTEQPTENKTPEVFTTTEIPKYLSTSFPVSGTTFSFDLTKPGSSLTSYVERVIPEVSSNIKTRLESNQEISMKFKIKPPQGAGEEYLKETTEILLKILPKFFPDDEISVKTQYLREPKGLTTELIANITIKPKLQGTVTESLFHDTKSEDELRSEPTTLTPEYKSQESTVPNEEKIIITTRIDNWQSTTAKEESTGSAEEETKSKGKSSLRINTSEKETKQTNAEETTQQEESTSTTTSNGRNIFAETTAPTGVTTEDISEAKVKPNEQPSDNVTPEAFTTTENSEYFSTSCGETTLSFDLTKPGSSLTSYIEEVIPEVSTHLKTRLERNHPVSMIFKIKPPQGSDEKYLRETTEILMKILPNFFPDCEVSVKTHYLDQPDGSTREIVANIIIKPKSATESEPHNTNPKDELKSEPTTPTPKYISEDTTPANEEKTFSTNENENLQTITAEERTTKIAEKETKQEGRSSFIPNTSEKEATHTNSKESLSSTKSGSEPVNIEPTSQMKPTNEEVDIDLSNPGVTLSTQINQFVENNLPTITNSLRVNQPETISLKIKLPPEVTQSYVQDMKQSIESIFKEYFPDKKIVINVKADKDSLDASTEMVVNITIEPTPTEKETENFKIDLTNPETTLENQVNLIIPGVLKDITQKLSKNKSFSMNFDITPNASTTPNQIQKVILSLQRILTNMLPRTSINFKITKPQEDADEIRVEMVISPLTRTYQQETVDEVNIDLSQPGTTLSTQIKEKMPKVLNSVNEKLSKNIQTTLQFNIKIPSEFTETNLQDLTSSLVTILPTYFPNNEIIVNLKAQKNPQGFITEVIIKIVLQPSSTKNPGIENIDIDLTDPSTTLEAKIQEKMPTVLQHVSGRLNKQPVILNFRIEPPSGSTETYLQYLANKIEGILVKFFPNNKITVSLKAEKNPRGLISEVFIKIVVQPSSNQNNNHLEIDLTKGGTLDVQVREKILNIVKNVKERLKKQPVALNFEIKPPFGSTDTYLQNLANDLRGILSEFFPSNEMIVSLKAQKDPRGFVTDVTINIILQPSSIQNPESVNIDIDLTDPSTTLEAQVKEKMPRILQNIRERLKKQSVTLNFRIEPPYGSTETYLQVLANNVETVLTKYFPSNKITLSLKAKKNPRSFISEVFINIVIERSSYLNRNNEYVNIDLTDPGTTLEVQVKQKMPHILQNIKYKLNKQPVTLNFMIEPPFGSTESYIQHLADNVETILTKYFPNNRITVSLKAEKTPRGFISTVYLKIVLQPSSRESVKNGNFEIDLTKPGTSFDVEIEKEMPVILEHVKSQLRKQPVTLNFRIKPPFRSSEAYLNQITTSIGTVLAKYFPENKMSVRTRAQKNSQGFLTEVSVKIILEPSTWQDVQFDLTKPGSNLIDESTEYLSVFSSDVIAKLNHGRSVNITMDIIPPYGSSQKYIQFVIDSLVPLFRKYFPNNKVNIEATANKNTEGYISDISLSINIESSFQAKGYEIEVDQTNSRYTLASRVVNLIPKILPKIQNDLRSGDSVTLTLRILSPNGSDQKYLQKLTDSLVPVLSRFFPRNKVIIDASAEQNSEGYLTKHIEIDITILSNVAQKTIEIDLSRSGSTLENQISDVLPSIMAEVKVDLRKGKPVALSFNIKPPANSDESYMNKVVDELAMIMPKYFPYSLRIRSSATRDYSGFLINMNVKVMINP